MADRRPGQGTVETSSGFPWPFLWAMVSVTGQADADERIPELLATPAAHRGVSYEPALGDPGDITAYLGPGQVEWVVAGCESGAGRLR